MKNLNRLCLFLLIDGRFMSFLICFSLVKNTKAVLNTDTPSSAILPINGIRTLSMFWVILGHVYAIGETAGGLGKLVRSCFTGHYRFYWLILISIATFGCSVTLIEFLLVTNYGQI